MVFVNLLTGIKCIFYYCIYYSYYCYYNHCCCYYDNLCFYPYCFFAEFPNRFPRRWYSPHVFLVWQDHLNFLTNFLFL